MWQAFNRQRQTRERRGHAFKGVGSGGGPGCNLQELVSGRRTLSHLNLLTAAFPRTLYFDGRASLGWHGSTTYRPSTFSAAFGAFKAMHWLLTTYGLRSSSHLLHNHRHTKGSNIVSNRIALSRGADTRGLSTKHSKSQRKVFVLSYLNKMDWKAPFKSFSVYIEPVTT